MIWWWLVVYCAQRNWHYQNKINFNLAMRPRPSMSISTVRILPTKYQFNEINSYEPQLAMNLSIMQSPVAYNPRHCYPKI